MQKITVSKPEFTYEILIGKGLIDRIGWVIKDYLPDINQNQKFIIAMGEEIQHLFLAKIQNSLRDADFEFSIEIILKDKLDFPADTIAIIVGGNRFKHLMKTLKSNYIYVPTTMLGMANNAVMGHPQLVISDINALQFLDYKYIMSGYSEIAKHALMRDEIFFEWLETHGRTIFDGDEYARIHAIKSSCSIKAKYVHNHQIKKYLQFGHLIADSLEKIYKKELLHGEYMSLGMVAAFDLAHKLNLCKLETYKRVKKHLKSMSLPVYLPEYLKVNIHEIIENINFENPVILPTNIGQITEYEKPITKEVLIRVVKNLLN